VLGAPPGRGPSSDEAVGEVESPNREKNKSQTSRTCWCFAAVPSGKDCRVALSQLSEARQRTTNFSLFMVATGVSAPKNRSDCVRSNIV
jgi:hypothetical protein